MSTAPSYEADEAKSKRATAIRYLGEMKDIGYLQLLWDVARNDPHDSEGWYEAMFAIAELGHGHVLGFLAAATHGRDEGQEVTATLALSFTASREAVNLLIKQFDSPSENVKQAAELGLEALTHRGPTEAEKTTPDYKRLQRRWQDWWALNGQMAPIYEYHQCGEKKPLS